MRCCCSGPPAELGSSGHAPAFALLVGRRSGCRTVQGIPKWSVSDVPSLCACCFRPHRQSWSKSAADVALPSAQACHQVSSRLHGTKKAIRHDQGERCGNSELACYILRASAAEADRRTRFSACTESQRRPRLAPLRSNIRLRLWNDLLLLHRRTLIAHLAQLDPRITLLHQHVGYGSQRLTESERRSKQRWLRKMGTKQPARVRHAHQSRAGRA